MNNLLLFALNLSEDTYFENGIIRVAKDKYRMLIEMTGFDRYSDNTYQNLVEIWKILFFGINNKETCKSS